ncbi:MAG: WYL domain-containing protein, partial [Candidatus Nanopelagicales bacterium]
MPSYADAPSDDAFERMFERDKEELRGMGVPVETVVSSEGEVEGYRIDAGDYAMPEISFTAEELSVLGLAAQAWTDAAVSAPARSALRKVEAIVGSRGELPGGFWRTGSPIRGEAELPVLWAAIRTRQIVAFDYVALGEDQPTTREVHPWATVRWKGAWYLAGWNPQRGDKRVYRLSRIVGEVRPLASQFEPVDPGDVRDLVANLAAPEPDQVAIVRLPVDRGDSLRERGRILPDGLIELSYRTGDHLLSEVLTSGGSFAEPGALRAAARAELTRVVRRHSEVQDA